MTDGRQRESWNHTATLMAHIDNNNWLREEASDYSKYYPFDGDDQAGSDEEFDLPPEMKLKPSQVLPGLFGKKK
jgi:hypothetical protein